MVHNNVALKACIVDFGFDSSKKPDDAFGLPQQPSTTSVIHSMVSAKYYAII